jgi:hypothetical protein
VLGPGDHFSDAWLAGEGGSAVRAVSAVETVALRADQAGRLQRVLASAHGLADS